MATLVLLSGSHVALTLDELRTSLDRAFPGEFVPQRDDRSFVVGGDHPGEPYLIKSLIHGAEGIFLFHNQPSTAEDWPNEDWDDADDPALRRLAAADHGWMSINMIDAITTEAAAYNFMLRVLARLAPNDAGFLLQPSQGCVPFTDHVRRAATAGQDPFSHM